jgi:peptide/nickel transport system substrate-binding protein
MRDRHIFWDIAPVVLLTALLMAVMILVIDSKRSWEKMDGIQKQNNEILSALSRGVRFNGGEKGASIADIKPLTSRLYDGSDIPKVPHGDEDAVDGDWLVLNAGSEPNSLNPLIDNDATASQLFGRANDNLVARCFDDLKYWEPRLARAWEKTMLCRGIAQNKNAKELAKKLNKALDVETRNKLNIVSISAESDEILHIDLVDVSGDYREAVLKILGADAIAEQHWIYVSFENGAFEDGTPLTAHSTAQALEKVVTSTPGFKGRLLPTWEREGSVALQVVGSGELVEKAVKDFIESKQNTGQVVDPKSASGKREAKIFTYNVTEKYVFEEKPIFTFHLRKDVKWHDGKPFTGKDVVFSFNAVMNPKVEAPQQRNYLQDCESVKLVNNDPHIVQYIWKKPYFLAFNFSAGLDILPEHVYAFTDPKQFNEGPQNQTIVGSGAYKLERWDRKEQFVFVRNEEYYGPKPHFKKVVYKLVQDRTVAMQLLQTGKLDVQGLVKSQVKAKQEDPEFTSKFDINVSVANVYRYIGWNARQPMFASANVRRALTKLVNRERICKDIYRGFALPLHGPAHPDSPVYSKELEAKAIPFNIEQAVRELKEEGWADTDGDNVLDKNGQPFKFTLLIVTGSPEYESVANLIKSNFAEAGIVVNISNLEWSVLLQKIERHQFDAVILGWQLRLEDDPYPLWHSSQTVEKGSNHCNFVSQEADRLIEEGRRELDEAKRIQKFRRVNELIVQEQPYTFLFVEKRTTAYDRRIKNVVFKLIGANDDRWWVPLDKQRYK